MFSQNQRMNWWRQAKVGMFVHWGPYAALNGDSRGHDIPFPAEWSRHALRIPEAEYHELAKNWNPRKFQAESWVRTMQEAGMKYLVFTSKHHDGFCMFHAENTDFNITNSAFGRDVCDELYQACEAGGIRFGLYYSPRDWDHPDYPQIYYHHDKPGKVYGGWYGGSPASECGCWGCKANLPLSNAHENGCYSRYVEYLKEQIAYLLKRYPHLSVLWFDGQDHKVEEARTEELLAMIREMNPGVIVNDRIGYQGFRADFGVQEQKIPETGEIRDWETCMTIPRWSWGYDPNADTAHTPEDIIRHLADVVSKGGNFLLNVSPDELGVIPEYQRERLLEMGRWLRRFGDAVYGTTAAGLPCKQEDVRFTKKGDTLYILQVLHPGRDIRIPEMTLPENARIELADGACQVRWENSPEGLHIRVGELPLALWKGEEVLAFRVAK